jgi:tRNA threonylcarbamoyladenosine biosynthesis protein TsaB
MSLILNIDTATETAGVFLAKEGVLINSYTNYRQNDHASWIHVAIEKLMKDSGYSFQDLEAVAVTQGPGSYTGLRVGMATAKGLCYTLSIPLITESTLKLMAATAVAGLNILPEPRPSLFCPLIDARRMEVFTAVFTSQLEELVAPSAMILNENSFEKLLATDIVMFFGSGAAKWEKLCHHINARFEMIMPGGKEFSLLSYSKFLLGDFADLAYAEPVYLKEFYTHPK